MSTIFHMAFKVSDLTSTIKFYKDILGCNIGRQTDHWVDFDFFGNQLSAHVSNELPPIDNCGQVDGIKVPIPHFGCVLESEKFEEIKEKLIINNVNFIVSPQKRYEGKPGEQLTMFVLDFSGNPLEFKSIVKEEQLFVS